MNLWFRLIYLLLAAPFRPRLGITDGVSRLRFRAWFTDLDLNGHVNNGRYWTLFDLGRTDLILRSGLFKVALKRRWAPMVAGGAIRFRRELKPLQRFVLETRLNSWAGSHIVIEHRILTGDTHEVVATRALVLGGLYDRQQRRHLPAETIFASVGVTDAPSPPPDEAAQALLDLHARLKMETP